MSVKNECKVTAVNFEIEKILTIEDSAKKFDFKVLKEDKPDYKLTEIQLFHNSSISWSCTKLKKYTHEKNFNR